MMIPAYPGSCPLCGSHPAGYTGTERTLPNTPRMLALGRAAALEVEGNAKLQNAAYFREQLAKLAGGVGPSHANYRSLLGNEMTSAIEAGSSLLLRAHVARLDAWKMPDPEHDALCKAPK